MARNHVLSLLALTLLGVEPWHLPLLLASRRFASADESQPLDRVRLQKGVFLIEKRGPAEWERFFDFVPYNWGPYSRVLQSTVDQLLAAELMTATVFAGSRYPAISASPLGERALDAVVGEIAAPYLQFVEQIRAFVTTRTFTRLLRDVYAAYPEYAMNSQFAG